MYITRLEKIPLDKVIKGLRKVRLKGYGQPLVYKDAEIILIRQDPLSIVPTQKYILNSECNRLLRLYQALMDYGVNLYLLCEGVRFWVRDLDWSEQGPFTILPPIIELFPDTMAFQDVELHDPGPHSTPIPILNDGMHRVFSAIKLRIKINIISIKQNPNKTFPYYAYGLLGGWNDVKLMDELPDGFVKKHYRDPTNYKALFRDFNEFFPGIQTARKKSNPSHIQSGEE